MPMVLRKCYNTGDRVVFVKEKIQREGVIISYKAPYYLIQTEKHRIPFSVQPKQIQQKIVQFEFSIP
jgi:hypothetical protein